MSYKRKYKINRCRYIHDDRIRHIDKDWIDDKFTGRSGACEYNGTTGYCKIEYIWQVPKIKIFYYNIILWIRYVKRNIKRMCRGEFYG